MTHNSNAGSKAAPADANFPVAEEFFAKRDGILTLKYKDSN